MWHTTTDQPIVLSPSVPRTTTHPLLSVVIPAYNEEKRLKKTLPGLRGFLVAQDYNWEVILADDGSEDQTVTTTMKFFRGSEVQIIRNPRNRGKGYAVKQGVLAAKGDIVLISDADFSTPIDEFEALYSYIQKGYDIAIGSRGLEESNIIRRQPWLRQKIGRSYIYFVRLLGLRGFEDTQCGFKCFRRKAVTPVFSRMKIDHFSFDVELLYIALKRNLRIKEVPVIWKNDPESKVNVFKDSVRMLYDLIRMRWNDFHGHYD